MCPYLWFLLDHHVLAHYCYMCHQNSPPHCSAGSLNHCLQHHLSPLQLFFSYIASLKISKPFAGGPLFLLHPVLLTVLFFASAATATVSSCLLHCSDSAALDPGKYFRQRLRATGTFLHRSSAASVLLSLCFVVWLIFVATLPHEPMLAAAFFATSRLV